MQIINAVHKYLAQGQSWFQRDVNTITTITVHHTASLAEGKSHEQILQEIYHEHVEVNGWPGISYHEIIMPDGTVYQLNNFEDITWQDTHNFDSYAVCVVGYFHQPYNQLPTSTALASLKSRLDDLCNNHPEFPASAENVMGHRDRFATACPGDNLYPQVQGYREQKGNVSWGAATGEQPTSPTTPPSQVDNAPPVTPSNNAGEKIYTQAQYDAAMNDRAQFWRERDMAVQKNAEFTLEVQDLQTKLHDVNNRLTPFVVSGYNTLDDINKKIDQLTKDKSDLYEENQKLLASNGVLAGQVEKVSTEDSKTAELGQSYIDKNKELNDFITELSKELGAKNTEAKAIFARVFELRDQADQWLKTLPKEENAVIEGVNKVKTDGIKWLMNLLNLSKTRKGGE